MNKSYQIDVLSHFFRGKHGLQRISRTVVSRWWFSLQQSTRHSGCCDRHLPVQPKNCNFPPRPQGAFFASPTASWFDYSAGNVGVIRVEGRIIADGTAADNILFTRSDAGYWGTILIDEQASSAFSLTHCIVDFQPQERNIHPAH